MASRRGGHAVKNYFSAVSIAVIQKTSVQIIMRKSLTAHNE